MFAPVVRLCLQQHDPYRTATLVVAALADAGWHLLTHEDAEKMVSAYVVQQVRSGAIRPADAKCNPEHAHDGPCGASDCWWPTLMGPQSGRENER